MKIEIRNEKLWLVRHAVCGKCGGQMLSIDDAARQTNLRARAIFRVVETGDAHFREASDGTLLVCFASLFENNDMMNEEKIKGEQKT